MALLDHQLSTTESQYLISNFDLEVVVLAFEGCIVYVYHQSHGVKDRNLDYKRHQMNHTSQTHTVMLFFVMLI